MLVVNTVDGWALKVLFIVFFITIHHIQSPSLQSPAAFGTGVPTYLYVLKNGSWDVFHWTQRLGVLTCKRLIMQHAVVPGLSRRYDKENASISWRASLEQRLPLGKGRHAKAGISAQMTREYHSQRKMYLQKYCKGCLSFDSTIFYRGSQSSVNVCERNHKSTRRVTCRLTVRCTIVWRWLLLGSKLEQFHIMMKWMR